jgi:non-ribosomal peptide synthetase component F
MDTRELDQKIRRACLNTIGDAVGRSVARNPEKDALTFGGRRWSYAELDAGANRVAKALLARGLEKGERVAAYGINSDGYVLLWFARTGDTSSPRYPTTAVASDPIPGPESGWAACAKGPFSSTASWRSRANRTGARAYV